MPRARTAVSAYRRPRKGQEEVLSKAQRRQKRGRGIIAVFRGVWCGVKCTLVLARWSSLWGPWARFGEPRVAYGFQLAGCACVLKCLPQTQSEGNDIHCVELLRRLPDTGGRAPGSERALTRCVLSLEGWGAGSEDPSRQLPNSRHSPPLLASKNCTSASRSLSFFFLGRSLALRGWGTSPSRSLEPNGGHWAAATVTRRPARAVRLLPTRLPWRRSALNLLQGSGLWDLPLHPEPRGKPKVLGSANGGGERALANPGRAQPDRRPPPPPPPGRS